MFGTFVKEKRLSGDMTLREFCRKLNEDPSNWSKIEREKLSPPQEDQKLARIAAVLGIEVGTDGWNTLVDYAALDNKNIPEYVLTNKELMGMLPVFFRTAGSVKPTREEIMEMIENLKRVRG